MTTFPRRSPVGTSILAAPWLLGAQLLGAQLLGGCSADGLDDAVREDAIHQASNACGSHAWPTPCAIAVTPNPAAFKNRIEAFRDPFIARPAGQMGWVKFTILTEDPHTVYFQNSNLENGGIELHYDFARRHLDPLAGATAEEFEQISLYGDTQSVVTGAVLFAPGSDYDQGPREMGILFERRDPYPAAMVADLFATVKGAIDNADGANILYFPTFDQREAAASDAPCLAAEGIEIGSVERWINSDGCYANGWALGRLRYVATSEIDDAYFAGELTADDILLTDQVPAEVPPLSGIVSLAPGTPSSHVAILAQNTRVPFGYAHGRAADVAALDGTDVVLRVRTDDYGDGCQVDVIDATGVPATTRAYLASLKEVPPLDYRAIETLGEISRPIGKTATSNPLENFGGKAANYHLLVGAIEDHAPGAMAFSFDLWQRFMATVAPIGASDNGSYIDEQLQPFGAFPVADPAGLRQRLDRIRHFIRDAAFDDADRAAIIAALQSFGFPSDERIRFRSSTNVEDTAAFTGAGLYDSYSGCLGDDLDGDDVGPSACATDFERTACENGVDIGACDERGVFRAIQRVFASFYNYNAYVERRRHRVDEDEVGMAVLVHESFPDEIERANGVAILEKSRWSGHGFHIVSQTGAYSVANPEDDMQPEIVDGSLYLYGTDDFSPDNFYLSVTQRSTGPIPAGTTVLGWRGDYDELGRLLFEVAKAFEAENPGLEAYGLDFEYKLIDDDGVDRLIVKQVRRFPIEDSEATVVPVLINRPTELCVFQGESNDVFATHRMKGTWNVAMQSVVLDEQARAQTLLDESTRVSLVDSATGELVEVTSPVSAWEHTRNGNDLIDSFRVGDATIRFSMSVPARVAATATPIVTAEEMWFRVEAEYDNGRATIDYNGVPTTTTGDFVQLTATCPGTFDLDTATSGTQRLSNGDGVDIDVSYYYPEVESGMIIKTFPLGAWGHTEIRGLTTEPIVLTKEASRSFEPGHHNFYEVFLFEPAFDDLSSEQRQELLDRDIAQIHVTTTMSLGDPPSFWFVGIDGEFRRTVAAAPVPLIEIAGLEAASAPFGSFCQ